jgi:hypothetical protein
MLPALETRGTTPKGGQGRSRATPGSGNRTFGELQLLSRRHEQMRPCWQHALESAGSESKRQRRSLGVLPVGSNYAFFQLEM